MECKKWIHGQCTKWKKITSALAQSFVCNQCEMMKSEMYVETTKKFYLENALNASVGSEMTKTARTRWIKFQECEEVLFGRRVLLKIKIGNAIRK